MNNLKSGIYFDRIDVKEVTKGYDCGIQVKGFNDIEINDVIEAYHEVAIKKKLK